MIPVILYPFNLQVDFILLSTDPRPANAQLKSILFETDTEKTFLWDGTNWIELGKGLVSRLHVYDVGTGEWIPVDSTTGLTVTLDEPISVSGPLTDTELRASPVDVAGPLTDTELRASDIPITLDGEVVATTSVANSTATGIIDDLNETVECVVSPGASTVGCQLTGTWSGVGDLVCFEGTVDGTNWTFIYGNLTSLGSLAVMISGSNGIYQIAAAGMVKVRVRGYTWATPGSCTVSFNSSVGSSASLLALPLPSGTNLIGIVGISEDNKAQVVYEDADILYVCKAVIGSLKASAVWQIKKVDGMDITWCDGNALYDNVATSLAIVELLSYS